MTYDFDTLRQKFPVNKEWGHDKLENVLQGAAGLLDVIKGEWAEAWSEFDQSVRNGITLQLAALANRGREGQGGAALKIETLLPLLGDYERDAACGGGITAASNLCLALNKLLASRVPEADVRRRVLEEVKAMLEEQKRDCLENAKGKYATYNQIRADEIDTALVNLRALAANPSVLPSEDK